MAQLNRRAFHQAMLGGAAALTVGVGNVRAQFTREQELLNVDLITDAAQQSVSKGLRYLSRRQNRDGSFGGIGYSQNVGVCALAGMAFMAGGNTPGRGKYGTEVTRCLSYVQEHGQESGMITEPSAASHGPMYGHGFATLFLAEVYGMSGDTTVREKLAKAVKLIIETQNDEGGWRYYPQKDEADISVTICQVMALRAARNAGIFVPNETIDRVTEYVKRSQNPDGGFTYMIQGGASAFPRSAAGVVALYSAGVYEGEEIDKGLGYLKNFTPKNDRFTRESHYFYGQYYAAQAMWHAGGKHWREWYPAIRDELIGKQLADGRWRDNVGPEYATAMSCIILQMPNNYLPIFQR